MPLLYWNLHSRFRHAVPQTVLGELQSYFRWNARRNLWLIREITNLIGLLQAKEIPVIVFKGPLLGAMAYGNLFLRASADVDILVHEHDLPSLKKLLSAEGYVLPHLLSRFQVQSLVAYAPECHFVGAAKGIELDVHWQILPRVFNGAFDCQRAWERIHYLNLRSRRIPTLSHEDLLLFLCIHGSKHLWERLGWICDITGLIGASRGLDWAEVLKRAEVQGDTRMLLLGVALARDLMSAEIPPEVSVRIREDSEIEGLAAQVREWLASERTSEIGVRERISFHLRLNKRSADKIRYLIRSAMAPTIGDLLLLNLPQALSFLYYVIRPFRLLAKCGQLAVDLFRAELRFRRASE